MTHTADGLLGSDDPKCAGLSRAAILGALGVYAGLLALGWWALMRFTPDDVSLSLAGRHLEVHNVHDRLLRDGAVILTLLPLAFWIECLVVGWERCSLRRLFADRTPSLKTDLSVLLLGQGHVLDLVSKVLTLGAGVFASVWLRDRIAAATGFQVDASALPFLVQLVIYFYAYTFFDYWTHRFDHGRFFWPLHRYHHSARDFGVVTAARQHPAAFLGPFVVNLPMAFLGASPSVMIWVNVLVTGIGSLIHSEIKSDWGWVGRWIVQSPLHHRLHHKLDMTEKTGHFGVAPIWDRLFGTWYDNAHKYPEIGVSAPYRHGYFIVPDMARDYWHFWSGWFVRRTE